LFIVDKPYVSDLLKRTIRDHEIPVVGTEISREMELYPDTKILTEEEAVELAQRPGQLNLYTNSENSLGWIAEHLSFSDQAIKIELFKNKTRFRELTRTMVPDFFFKSVKVEDLGDIDFSDLPAPVILKPSTGFMSEDVHKIKNSREWDLVLNSIQKARGEKKNLYPREVVDTNTFIIESCVKGDEFAFDVYYDVNGKPIILNIFRHTFSSADDVSDRIYTSSKDIIENNLAEFTEFAARIGELAEVKSFPAHIELRRSPDGTLVPIEVNPLRFGGWCTTADLTYFAYGYNPYSYYYSQNKPDWPEILKDKAGKLYSIIILDNSTGISPDRISSFDYDRLWSDFENPLELRKFDYKKYPIFGFLFTETNQENQLELKQILDSDLREYITIED
jgi:hypothetical protein